jgi:hypothetical protein
MAERIKFAPERQKHPESAQYHLAIAPTLRNSSCSVRGPGFGKWPLSADYNSWLKCMISARLTAAQLGIDGSGQMMDLKGGVEAFKFLRLGVK